MTKLLGFKKDEFPPLNWPPTDKDFLQILDISKKKKNNFSSVLHYVKYDVDNPILIYDPVHIGPGQQYRQTFKLDDTDSFLEIILLEKD